VEGGKKHSTRHIEGGVTVSKISLYIEERSMRNYRDRKKTPYSGRKTSRKKSWRKGEKKTCEIRLRSARNTTGTEKEKKKVRLGGSQGSGLLRICIR